MPTPYIISLSEVFDLYIQCHKLKLGDKKGRNWVCFFFTVLLLSIANSVSSQDDYSVVPHITTALTKINKDTSQYFSTGPHFPCQLYFVRRWAVLYSYFLEKGENRSNECCLCAAWMSWAHPAAVSTAMMSGQAGLQDPAPHSNIRMDYTSLHWHSASTHLIERDIWHQNQHTSSSMCTSP